MEPLLSPPSLASLAAGHFQQEAPFGHAVMAGLLSADAFERLEREYPPLVLFERHVGLPRRFDQAPHDRFYLELETSLYHPGDTVAPGVMPYGDLSPTWRQFIEELRGESYRRAMVRILGAQSVNLRFSWHVAFTGCSVSPHRDAREKLGTHLFYFNTEHGWSAAWGGATILFGRRTTSVMNPGFDEFETATEVPFLGNRSLVFRNERAAWHGMEPLTAPAGAYRKIFAVVFDRPNKRLPRLVDSAEAVAWRLARPIAALRRTLRRSRV
jgi:hypothetical protein